MFTSFPAELPAFGRGVEQGGGQARERSSFKKPQENK
jgi:hypothetical protein